jgi:hypothetical protein
VAGSRLHLPLQTRCQVGAAWPTAVLGATLDDHDPVTRSPCRAILAHYAQCRAIRSALFRPRPSAMISSWPACCAVAAHLVLLVNGVADGSIKINCVAW